MMVSPVVQSRFIQQSVNHSQKLQNNNRCIHGQGVQYVDIACPDERTTMAGYFFEESTAVCRVIGGK